MSTLNTSTPHSEKRVYQDLVDKRKSVGGHCKRMWIGLGHPKDACPGSM